MGRIAEALKKAQQERSRRAGASGATLAPEAPVAETPPPSGVKTAAAAGVARIVDAPAPRPFLITASPILPEAVAPDVVVFHDPGNPISERYRSARTRLVSENPGGGPRVFAITSSLPHEGKTVTTANLGFSMAELRHLRVAVIDCDFRRRGLTNLFKAGDRPGLAEFIRGEKALADVCVPVVRENLFLIPTGDCRTTLPGELLAGTQAAAAFREMHSRFHYGLIDTPPMDTVADIGMIAPLCHSVVIVIRMSRTPDYLLRRSVRMLQANHVEIAGSILVGYCERTMAYADNHDYYEGHS
jgi:capsular exopolysaccharide synthesis family protein